MAMGQGERSRAGSAGTEGASGLAGGDLSSPAPAGGQWPVALVGLDGFYFAHAFAARLGALPGVTAAGCCTLGLDDAEVAANCGEVPEAFGRRYGLTMYRDLEELLATEHPRAAVVATRPSRAGALAAALAERGVHVFLAKPGVTTPEAADAVRQAAARGGVCVAAGLTARLDPLLAEAARRVHAGEIGRPVAVRIAHQHGYLSGWPAGSWYFDPREGGPALFLGWYVVDLAQWLTGSPVVDLQVCCGHLVDRDSPFPDFYKGVGRTASGALLSLDVHFGVRYPWPSFEVEVLGDRGGIATSHHSRTGRMATASGVQPFEAAATDLEAAELGDWLTACAAAGRRPFFNADDLVATLHGCRLFQQAAAAGARG